LLYYATTAASHVLIDLNLLSLQGDTPALRPPQRATLPLWLALLLKKQKRANIVPPAWLHPASLQELITRETHVDPTQFSPPPPAPVRGDASGSAHRLGQDDLHLAPPFLPGCTADAPSGYLPYHWFELAEALLAHAGDDMPAAAGEVRGLLRDLVEVRAAKMRASTTALEGFGGGIMSLKGVGAMELAENRGFVLGVVDGVRRLGAAAEAGRREDEEQGFGRDDSDDDEDMGF
jgi:GINS complex subunit 2